MSCEGLFAALSGAEEWKKLLAAVEQGQGAVLSQVASGQRAFLAAALHRKTGRPVLLICPGEVAAGKAAQDINQLLGSVAAVLPPRDTQFSRSASSLESTWQRIGVLDGVLSGRVKVLCVSIGAMLGRYAPAARMRERTLRLAEKARVQPEKLMHELVWAGYERVAMVEGCGQCAARGSIVDVYPPSESNAVRIEFFDDEIDSIRTFDPISQRSLGRLKSVSIAPATECLLAEDEWEGAAERLKDALHMESVLPAHEQPQELPDLPPLSELFSAIDMEDADELPSLSELALPTGEVTPQVAVSAPETAARIRLEGESRRHLDDVERVRQGLPIRTAPMWMNVLCPKTVPVTDFFDRPIVLADEPEQFASMAAGQQRAYMADWEEAAARGDAFEMQKELLFPYAEVASQLNALHPVLMTDMMQGLSQLRPDTVIPWNSQPVSPYQSQMNALAQDIARWKEKGYSIVLLSGGEARGRRLQTTLADMDTPSVYTDSLAGNPVLREVLILPVTLQKGFVHPTAHIAVVSDTDIYGSSYQRARKKQNAGERIASFTDLKPGDYVVHEMHGVGLFVGITQMQSEGVKRDYLQIQYAGADKLYVPTDQFDRVQKFIGAEHQLPKLNKLGTGEWERQKSKVKAGLKKLAFDLVELYARRQKETGYAFSKELPWQKEFEDLFPYELTDDQQTCVAQIENDMESPTNMDRLLCGDVGYGKTEVALRAAFKAVVDGKQVAILAPTTILVQQHYNTVRKRFAGFPVTCDMLSRFRTPKEQKETIAQLAEGKIDLIVGTHRLLAKDVKFKDLGLLIVDEEHRFGVQHKEQIKQMKTRVDVLTLSATPIPRTLHMSMVGIRDMSLLETPPEERLPVKTSVMEYSDAVIRDGIRRELQRGGQVYFLYNRVRSIEQMAARLKALVPEARVGIAHGQMRENALEDVMLDFYAGTFDVLLCTTIIENGLDVPQANTLFVFDADRFGLSQLYQIRGRVGRSSRQAYAYFMVRRDKQLSETAEKRLAAIREFTEFGAGYRIAMRDLEIRGAGDVLGPQQHGHLSTVGYDMYCRLIEQAVDEAQGKVVVPELDTRVELRVDAFLPESYVADEKQRIEMYKRIAMVDGAETRMDIEEELIDRFGDIPDNVVCLMDIAHLRALTRRLGVSLVTLKQDGLHMRLDEKYVPDMRALLYALEQSDSRLGFTTRMPAELVLRQYGLTGETALKQAIPALEKVVRHLADAPAPVKES